MGGIKDGHLTKKEMADLLHPVLQQRGVHGWVLDGWPASLTAAKAAFSRQQPKEEPPGAPCSSTIVINPPASVGLVSAAPAVEYVCMHWKEM
jgi:hypothetical protein